MKTQKSHPFEFTLERDYLTLLEFDDSFENYGVQRVQDEFTEEEIKPGTIKFPVCRSIV